MDSKYSKCGNGYDNTISEKHSFKNENVIKMDYQIQLTLFKGIQWLFYKLGLKVTSGRDKNDGIGHFAELGSSWPGEPKTSPKIALRVRVKIMGLG